MQVLGSSTERETLDSFLELLGCLLLSLRRLLVRCSFAFACVWLLWLPVGNSVHLALPPLLKYFFDTGAESSHMPSRNLPETSSNSLAGMVWVRYWCDPRVLVFRKGHATGLEGSREVATRSTYRRWTWELEDTSP